MKNKKEEQFISEIRYIPTKGNVERKNKRIRKTQVKINDRYLPLFASNFIKKSIQKKERKKLYK